MTNTAPAGQPLAPKAQVAGAGCPIAPFLPHALLAGAGLLFLAFFLPWWGLRGVPEDRLLAGDGASKVQKVRAENAPWYATYAVWDKFQKERDSLLDAARKGQDVQLDQVSVSLFGWNTGPGVVAFIFFFLVIAFVLGPMFVPVLRPVAWIGYLASGVVYAGVFGMTVIRWVICTPGQDVEGLLVQGVSVGVWFALLGSVLASAAGTMAGLKALKGACAPGPK